VSDGIDPRLKLLMAMTPALESHGWQPIETVPKDGTEVQIRLVHVLAAYCNDPHKEGYIATARAHWIDHNGGGLTWYGLCGAACQWRPLGAGGPQPDHIAREALAG
jgi:hypothetical protein